MGFAVALSPLMRLSTRSSFLGIGAVVFWALLLTQVIADVISGHAAATHLLVLVGLPIFLF
jgi:hypothetical protein